MQKQSSKSLIATLSEVDFIIDAGIVSMVLNQKRCEAREDARIGDAVKRTTPDLSANRTGSC